MSEEQRERFMRLVEAARAMRAMRDHAKSANIRPAYVNALDMLYTALSDMEQAGDIPAADNPPPRG